MVPNLFDAIPLLMPRHQPIPPRGQWVPVDRRWALNGRKTSENVSMPSLCQHPPWGWPFCLKGFHTRLETELSVYAILSVVQSRFWTDGRPAISSRLIDYNSSRRILMRPSWDWTLLVLLSRVRRENCEWYRNKSGPTRNGLIKWLVLLTVVLLIGSSLY